MNAVIKTWTSARTQHGDWKITRNGERFDLTYWMHPARGGADKVISEIKPHEMYELVEALTTALEEYCDGY